MKTARHQKGMTGIGWLLTIAVIVFVMVIVIKLMPIYIDQFNVASVVSSLKNEPGINNMTSGEVTQIILKRLDINMVNNIKADDIYISQESNQRIIEVDYQVQKKLFANIDILISFNNRVEVSGN